MKKLTFFLLLSLVLFQTSAFAKEIRGRVIRIQPDSGKMTVSYFDPVSESWKMQDVLVRPETAYNGVEGFGDLIPGQAILVDAMEDDTYGLVATAIQASPAIEHTLEPEY